MELFLPSGYFCCFVVAFCSHVVVVLYARCMQRCFFPGLCPHVFTPRCVLACVCKNPFCGRAPRLSLSAADSVPAEWRLQKAAHTSAHYLISRVVHHTQRGVVFPRITHPENAATLMFTFTSHFGQYPIMASVL